jgi:hypothetical protein
MRSGAYAVKFALTNAHMTLTSTMKKPIVSAVKRRTALTASGA